MLEKKCRIAFTSHMQPPVFSKKDAHVQEHLALSLSHIPFSQRLEVRFLVHSSMLLLCLFGYKTHFTFEVAVATLTATWLRVALCVYACRRAFARR